MIIELFSGRHKHFSNLKLAKWFVLDSTNTFVTFAKFLVAKIFLFFDETDNSNKKLLLHKAS